MEDFFREIFEYTFEFNKQVIDLLLQSNTAVAEKALLLLNHTLNAHEVWNCRIEEQNANVGIWEIRPLETLNTINEQNYQKSLQILEQVNLDKKIRYTNSKGDVYVNNVRDILFHIVNHSTYHRGQIATECKRIGIAPLLTDYIFYKRNSL